MIDHSIDLKNAGLKITIPRLRILEIFETSATRHLSAEDIYKILINENMDIGLATVYRVLTQFQQAGLLLRNYFEQGKAVFELNHGEHHDHLICMKCQRVEEFYDEIIENRQHEIAQEHDFTIEGHSLSLYGVCSQCKKNKNDK